jgi:hypothetical protein
MAKTIKKKPQVKKEPASTEDIKRDELMRQPGWSNAPAPKAPIMGVPPQMKNNIPKR